MPLASVSAQSMEATSKVSKLFSQCPFITDDLQHVVLLFGLGAYPDDQRINGGTTCGTHRSTWQSPDTPNLEAQNGSLFLRKCWKIS